MKMSAETRECSNFDLINGVRIIPLCWKCVLLGLTRLQLGAQDDATCSMLPVLTIARMTAQHTYLRISSSSSSFITPEKAAVVIKGNKSTYKHKNSKRICMLCEEKQSTDGSYNHKTSCDFILLCFDLIYDLNHFLGDFDLNHLIFSDFDLICKSIWMYN